MTLIATALFDWPLWNGRLSARVGHDPIKLSIGQLCHHVYSYQAEGRDAQSREVLDASLEDRLPLSLKTKQPLGLDSDDPEVKLATRRAMIEHAKREAARRG